MPRNARKKSESGIYHVMLRGINGQIIFEDEEDHEKFMQVIRDCKQKSGFLLMAYCLMGNHLHLLIKEEIEELEKIIKRIGVRYVYWYNFKYKRTGHLFQDRFKSEPVNDDGYFLTVLRYILQNPVKAGLCTEVAEYKWSSYCDYIYGTGITDIELGLSLYDDEKEKAKVHFMKYMEEDEKIICLDMEQKNWRISDSEALEIIYEKCGVKSAADFQKMTQEDRDKNIAILKDRGLSIRQISRLTGISFGIIRK